MSGALSGAKAFLAREGGAAARCGPRKLVQTAFGFRKFARLLEPIVNALGHRWEFLIGSLTALTLGRSRFDGAILPGCCRCAS